jgi:hypothetical protein
MNNITGIGVIQLGNAKRLGITYQVIDESGKITADNQATNKIITNNEVLGAVAILNNFAQSIIDGTVYKPSADTADSSTTVTSQNIN